MGRLEEEIDKLLDADAGAKGLRSVPEFGRKMVGVLRAELGEVTRFQRADQGVAYAGLDLEVKQSGKWKEQTKLSRSRQWATAPSVVYDRGTLCSSQRLCLWGLLPSSAQARSEEKDRAHGSHAQDACDCCFLAQNRAGL